LTTKSQLSLTRFSPRPDDYFAGIEDLREKREEINQQITDEEDEKSKVQSDLTVLSKRLTTLNDSIARKVRIRYNSLLLSPSHGGHDFLSESVRSRHYAYQRTTFIQFRSPRGTITIRQSMRQKLRT
jgi:Sjoegren syndrome nuclear autoantigen 1